ncbi:MAG: hypothetical protein WC489_02425 [Patescibacteria group bacterium]
MLHYIITSKTRRKILELFYHNFGETYYLRKIVREIEEEVNAVKREVDILEKARVLHREKRLNKVFYSLNRSFLFYDEFLRIFTKTNTLAQTIYSNLAKLGKLKFVAISTKYARRISIKEDEIYLLFVGVVVVPELESIVDRAEKDFGQDIHYTVMTEEEFRFRKKNNDPFTWRFLKQPKVMLLGSEEDLLK